MGFLHAPGERGLDAGVGGPSGRRAAKRTRSDREAATPPAAYSTAQPLAGRRVCEADRRPFRGQALAALLLAGDAVGLHPPVDLAAVAAEMLRGRAHAAV